MTRSSVLGYKLSVVTSSDVVCFGKEDDVVLKVLVRASLVSRVCLHG